MASVAIIGSGFSGLSAAAYLSANGHRVSVFEKNDTPGGRARQLRTAGGYVFDMGPSWYWMPGIFEQFFKDMGHDIAAHLKLLDPSFEIVYPGSRLAIPAGFEELKNVFESIEAGSAEKLERFLKEAGKKYRIAMGHLDAMPGQSFKEYLRPSLIKESPGLTLFSSLSRHVRKFFKDPRLIALLEFPSLFLGAAPRHTPALYSLISYAAFREGTWYPMGGFGKITSAMVAICQQQGVTFHFHSPVEKILVENKHAKGIVTGGKEMFFDGVLSSADYHYTEAALLPAAYRNYSEAYWQKRTMAPSCLLFFIGLSKKITRLQHHTLFFDEDLSLHAEEIYRHPQWPSRPLFYVCCPSRTDSSVAPPGHENIFFLMPLAPGLPDHEPLREKYFNLLLRRFEKYIGEPIMEYIDFKQSYCISDFEADYHAYRGNAYGLANTLLQTGTGKPKMANKKIPNLFYAGQLTVPGPGVPPALISGKIAATLMMNYFKKSP